jgi:hypothetical protein
MVGFGCVVLRRTALPFIDSISLPRLIHSINFINFIPQFAHIPFHQFTHKLIKEEKTLRCSARLLYWLVAVAQQRP